MSEKADHLGLRKEDVDKRNEDENQGIAGLLRLMSDDPEIGDALARSEDGEIMDHRLSLMAMPEVSEQEMRYWASYEKGLHKEVHGEGLEKWASFVPLSAASDRERRYPLIFCLHGAHNPIQMTESYGIIQVAAREECIVIAPENENWESIRRLLDVAKEEYPVDWRRVYLMGYSFGGFSASRLGLAHPEIFAGIGMGGMLFANDVAAHELDGQWYEAYSLTEEMVEKARRLGIAISLVMGEHEMLGLLPIRREPGGEAKDGVIPLKPEEKMTSFNNFRMVSGCDPAVFPQPGEEKNDIERMTGIRFEKCSERTYYGRRYLFGFNERPDGGDCTFQTVAIEGMVHWPSSMFGEILWEHLSKFARDPESGKLIRL
ncbi:MAG: alpha/beta hydrolase-fold protein [Bilifractor sp.]